MMIKGSAPNNMKWLFTIALVLLIVPLSETGICIQTDTRVELIPADSVSVAQLEGVSSSDHGSAISAFLFKVSWVTLLLLGCLVLAAKLYKRFLFRAGKTQFMQIQGRQYLGPRQSLVVVELEGRRFLIGCTEKHIQLVSELDRAEAPFESEQNFSDESTGFLQDISRLLK